MVASDRKLRDTATLVSVGKILQRKRSMMGTDPAAMSRSFCRLPRMAFRPEEGAVVTRSDVGGYVGQGDRTMGPGIRGRLS